MSTPSNPAGDSAGARDQNVTVCAVVVTRNRLALLKECIDAIRGQTRPLDKILVVDNDSSDGTREWLSTQADLWVIEQGNLGGAGGFHRGIKEAVEAGFGAVWVMDDDVLPRPDALAKLCKAGRRVPRFGFLASRVVGVAGKPLNMPTLDKTPLDNGSPRWPLLAGEGLLGIRTATFVSLLIPADAVREMGLPIAEMFIWGDDIEYTTRLSQSFPSYWVLASEVVHKRGNQAHLSIVSETDPARIRMFAFNYRNNMYVALRYKEWRKLLMLLALSSRQMFHALFSTNGVRKVLAIVGGLCKGCFFWPTVQGVSRRLPGL